MTNGAETRRARTRAAILEAAERLFLRTGYSGTSMDEVAAEADVSKQTVYAHFGSKETLFVEMVEGMTGGAGDALLARVEDPSPDRPIEEFLHDFAVEQLRIVMTPRLLQLRRLVIGEVERFPELGATLHRRGPARSITRLASAFRAYAAQGVIAVPDPEAAGAYFNWLVMGGPTNDAMFLGDAAIPPESSFAPHARECVRIFIAAYGT
ncbi:TetR/AcrR family transcriptional regulator [Pontivivens ytuae]|uniref:TetR/AcrR family transcriptional regulator n=1 Tax=Pontivivens ytuae TaxID=2789856 RepID=A0A7S9LQ75_9RHOB|nr:TetR/AcrR family transcriptional regulator [Pontivivens ytuae]QPH53232.1 TetR/AcrR family transcriptional regulator [Pontivivens ytuae]